MGGTLGWLAMSMRRNTTERRDVVSCQSAGWLLSHWDPRGGAGGRHPRQVLRIWHFSCHSLVAGALEGWWLVEEILWLQTGTAHQWVLWPDVHLPPLLALPLWHGPCLLTIPALCDHSMCQKISSLT